MNNRKLLIDELVTALEENMSPTMAEEFVRFVKERLRDGSPQLKAFGAETLTDLSSEQRELFCSAMAKEFLEVQS